MFILLNIILHLIYVQEKIYEELLSYKYYFYTKDTRFLKKLLGLKLF